MGGLPTNRTINGFAADPKNPKLMYVAMRDGFFRSIDAGVTWKQTGRDLKNLAAIAVNPRKPNELYVARADGMIFLSSDGGVKWKKQSK